MSGVNIWLFVSTTMTSAFLPGDSSPASIPRPSLPFLQPCVRRLAPAGGSRRPGRPMHERGELHHLEHVPAVVALGRVVAEADVEPGREHLRQPRDAVAELRVRARVVRDVRVRLAHEGELGVGEPDAVRGDAVGPEDAAVVGDLGRTPAEHLLRDLHLGERLVQVDVDPGAELVRERSRVAEKLLGGERQPLDPDQDLDPAVGRAVLRAEGGLVVGERVEVVLVGRDVVRQDGADAELLGGLRKRLELPVHVVDGRHAALDRLASSSRAPPSRRIRDRAPGSSGTSTSAGTPRAAGGRSIPCRAPCGSGSRPARA